MSDHRPAYWFRAKRYGVGWGAPASWQGWVVLAVWFALLLSAIPWLIVQSPMLCALFVPGMTIGLVLICYLKGEPLRWQGGKEDGAPSRH